MAVQYKGPFYPVLHKTIRDNRLPKNLDILMVSAKYGLLKSDTIDVVQLVVKTNGNLRSVYIDVEGGNTLDIETTDQTVNEDTWHHIAFTVNLDLR